MANMNQKSIVESLLVDGKMVHDDSQKPFARELLLEFAHQLYQQGHVTSPNVSAFISERIRQIDELISAQLNEFMHQPEFLKLEGAWRGVHYLISNSRVNSKLKIRLLNVSKRELVDDFEKAIEFDQGALFKKVYEEEYGTFGGNPYSCLVADYEFSRSAVDLTLLEKLASVASAAHAPLLAAAHAKLFDIDTFENISAPRDLSKIFQSQEMAKWNGFRGSDDARYVSLFLPRVLMRLPYDPENNPVHGFHFVEDVRDAETNFFCWGNPAYVMAERITNAFSNHGWTAAIRGVEGGGLVSDLPAYAFKTAAGDMALKCPTEVAITDRREKELSDQGFIALCHCKGTDYATFFGGQTVQRAKLYEAEDANANASLSARLPYVLAASRFAHYIKVMMRDKIGSFMTRDKVELFLNTWLARYILLNDDAPQSIKAQYPLREGRVDVFDVPGQPGAYRAVVYLRPHFQMEELTASIRLVATLPPPAQ